MLLNACIKIWKTQMLAPHYFTELWAWLIAVTWETKMVISFWMKICEQSLHFPCCSTILIIKTIKKFDTPATQSWNMTCTLKSRKMRVGTLLNNIDMIGFNNTTWASLSLSRVTSYITMTIIMFRYSREISKMKTCAVWKSTLHTKYYGYCKSLSAAIQGN